MIEEEFIGRMAALLQMNEQSVEESRAAQKETADLASRLNMAAREVDELRGLVVDLGRIVRDSQTADWVTSVELAKELRVDPRTIRYWYEKGQIPGYKLSPTEKGHIRFDKNEVYAAIKKRARVNAVGV